EQHLAAPAVEVLAPLALGHEPFVGLRHRAERAADLGLHHLTAGFIAHEGEPGIVARPPRRGKEPYERSADCFHSGLRDFPLRPGGGLPSTVLDPRRRKERRTVNRAFRTASGKDRRPRRQRAPGKATGPWGRTRRRAGAPAAPGRRRRRSRRAGTRR